jgi:hypothetical protein
MNGYRRHGLVHISQISQQRTDDVNDVLQRDEEVITFIIRAVTLKLISECGFLVVGRGVWGLMYRTRCVRSGGVFTFFSPSLYSNELNSCEVVMLAMILQTWTRTLICCILCSRLLLMAMVVLMV